jgi:hypothetical protein
MSELLTILSTVVTTAQKLRGVSEKIKDADAKNLVADLNLSLADLKMKVAELQEENLEIRNQLTKVHDSSEIRMKLAFREGVYFLDGEHDNRPPGPYCTRCFDKTGVLMLLSELPTAVHGLGRFRCPDCEAVYV